jgi:pyrroline-5-carboxylate reductase
MAAPSSAALPADAVVAFIGSGNMAQAILRGLLAKGIVAPAQLRVASPSGGRPALGEAGVACFTDNAAAVVGATLVVLAVKPVMMSSAMASIRSSLAASALIISVAAGTTIATMEAVSAHPPPYRATTPGARLP